jgi:LuxR family transcriptional regulator, maltose regulon positive regulatory protein
MWLVEPIGTVPTMTVDVHDAARPPPALGQVLVDAKFAVPQPRTGSVSRAALVEAARSSKCILVAVTAPAGYGKSTFLAEWARAEDRRMAWVSLDRFDDDPAMLLVSLASACYRAGLGGADLVAEMGGLGVSVLGRAAPRLASALRASPHPFVLMLDDLHELRSPACDDVMSVVIAAIPAGSALVTASRSEQPHLPRLRAADEALEFGAGDLALDAAGAHQIFANAHVSITREQAAAVTDQTEGWPAGLHLAALVAKKSGGQAQTISGDDRYVTDYLYRETLIQQPEHTQRFLRRTAILDQLCVPLCDAVLGSSGAAGQLRQLEAASLFVIPLDRRREWYRYHALFRAFLLGELRRTEPGMMMALHRRAADWYEASGSPALALEHLLQATDWERSMRLAAALSLPTYNAGQLSTVQRWYRAIGDENIERYPPLAVLKCWEVALTGDTTHAARWAAVLDASSFDGESLDGSASFESARAMVRSAMCASGPGAMMADAAFAVAQEPASSSWRAMALYLLGEARLLAGESDQARSLLTEASSVAVLKGDTETAVICDSELALLAMDRGQWQEAAVSLERALVLIDEHRMHDYVYSLLAFAEAARLAVRRGDLAESRRQIAQAMRSRPSATYLLPCPAVRLRLQLAKVCLAIAEVVAARQLLRETDDILSHRPALGTLTEQAEELRRALASSDGAGANCGTPLTPAELRLLPYLQTHLTAGGIADRLFVSSHTVKAEVKSIYRKLGVSSRDEAVQKATAIGLLGG